MTVLGKGLTVLIDFIVLMQRRKKITMTAVKWNYLPQCNQSHTKTLPDIAAALLAQSLSLHHC
jgi:hypothetical protein